MRRFVISGLARSRMSQADMPLRMFSSQSQNNYREGSSSGKLFSLFPIAAIVSLGTYTCSVRCDDSKSEAIKIEKKGMKLFFKAVSRLTILPSTTRKL